MNESGATVIRWAGKQGFRKNKIKEQKVNQTEPKKPKIIAVDFDGTLCENRWPEIGPANVEVVCRLKDEQENGAKVILWTCREGKLLMDAVWWCGNHGIHLDAVNENLPELIEEYGGDCRKISASEYWDDKAVPIK